MSEKRNLFAQFCTEFGVTSIRKVLAEQGIHVARNTIYRWQERPVPVVYHDILWHLMRTFWTSKRYMIDKYDFFIDRKQNKDRQYKFKTHENT